MTSLALMYHNLVNSWPESSNIPLEERPYTLTCQQFREQLDQIDRLQFKISDPYSFEGDILLTFDDGHSSFLESAMPILQEHNASALFFISPGLMQNRFDFVKEQQLRSIVEAGNNIGSHGWSHKFLSDLSSKEIHKELSDSKHYLEDHCGQQVTCLSFPGGRFNNRVKDIALALGFVHCFNSEFKAIKNPHEFVLPRIAIRASTNSDEFIKIISQDTQYFRHSLLVSHLKKLTKRMLGNQNYDRLYRLYRLVKG